MIVALLIVGAIVAYVIGDRIGAVIADTRDNRADRLRREAERAEERR